MVSGRTPLESTSSGGQSRRACIRMTIAIGRRRVFSGLNLRRLRRYRYFGYIPKTDISYNVMNRSAQRNEE